MGDVLNTATNPTAHFEDSPYWNITKEMSGPDLRDRFNREILPALDKNKDGFLTDGELHLGSNKFDGTRNADAVRLLINHYSFFLDFRGMNTPGYFMALNGETMGRFAEFDKSMKRFNAQVHSTVDYTLRNFARFDTDRNNCLSFEELKAKATQGNTAEKDFGNFLVDNYWGVAHLVSCEGSGSGVGRAGLIDLRQRRTAPGERMPETAPVASPGKKEFDIEVERPDPSARPPKRRGS